MTEAGLDEIVLLTNAKLAGVELDHYRAATRLGKEEAQGVAVLPIYGPISKRGNIFLELFGGVSTESLSQQIREAVASPSMGSIVLDVDSPGGSVAGIEELANEIFEASKKKRIVAVANSQAASAAYCLSSQASEFAITPSGEAGSVGVLAAHIDESKALEKDGIKVTLITAGRYKREGNPYEALSSDARSHMQSRVDAYYDSFVRAVSRGRHLSVKTVREGFGEGRVLGARQALTAGMVDRIATLDEVIGELMISPKQKPRIAATFGLAFDRAVSLSRLQ
jgi:signal peptide peptidase SppA